MELATGTQLEEEPSFLKLWTDGLQGWDGKFPCPLWVSFPFILQAKNQGNMLKNTGPKYLHGIINDHETSEAKKGIQAGKMGRGE